MTARGRRSSRRFDTVLAGSMIAGRGRPPEGLQTGVAASTIGVASVGKDFPQADDCLLQLCRVDVEGGGVDVHEDRRRAEEADHLGRRDEGEGRREDGVARADSEGHERHEEGVRPRGAADGVLCADVAGEGLLQLPDLRAVDVLAVGEDPGDIGIQFIRDAPLLRGKIDKIHDS